MTIIDDELFHSYLAECAENLAIMEKSLLALELDGTGADGEIIDQLLRAAQSIQAGAGPCGLANIDALAQRMAHALAPMRLDRVTPSAERVTVLLQGIDTLRSLLENPGASNAADLSKILDAFSGPSVKAGAPGRGPDWRLRVLLVEDDFTSRFLLRTFLSRYGECHIAVNGQEAVGAFREALERGQGYDMICMDIMMPEMDGSEAVRQIRAMEEAKGIPSTAGAKIFMTTAVNDIKAVAHSFHDLCDAYLLKPIDLGQLVKHMKAHDLVGVSCHQGPALKSLTDLEVGNHRSAPPPAAVGLYNL